MTDIITLNRGELEEILRSVLEMNERIAGQIQFLDANGAAVAVETVMVACTAKGITVFPPKPKETPEDIVARFSRTPLDPKAMPQPASMAELAALVGQ